jgi:radical SAM protein with 4Fe4S-binding SPASM domain
MEVLMLKFQAPYKAEHIPFLPPKVRPIVRYRPEEFGYLAAFPDGRLALLDYAAEPLLAAGSSYDECAPHKVTRLKVSNEFHFSAPLMAWIELTRLCNLRCPHCFVDAGEKREVEMPTSRLLSLLDEFAEMGTFSVVITGGEPSLQPDFLEIVNHAYDLGFTVAIASNGMPLTPKVLAQIPRDDVIISLSLDGIHGQGAPTGEDDFTAATRRILEIRDQGFNTSFMTTTTHDNVGDLQKFITFAMDNNVSIRSVPFSPMGRGKFYKELQNRIDDIEKAAQFWITEEKWGRIKDQELGLCSGKVFAFLFTMVYSMQRCMSGRGLCYITSDGTVYPCSNCSSSALFPGGNLLEKSMADIWNDDSWPIRGVTWKSYLKDVCEGCALNDDTKFFCTGRCPGSSMALNGEVIGCGVSDFQRHSILRREELFREEMKEEPGRRLNSDLQSTQVGTDRLDTSVLPSPPLVQLGPKRARAQA